MALEKYGVPAFEYTPMEVKQVLTGFGRADKKQVEQMVKYTLNCDNLPKLDDTIDSIAIAICHTRKNTELIKVRGHFKPTLLNKSFAGYMAF